MAVHNLKDLLAEGVSGRGVLVRSDLNVPLDDGKITDAGRITASVPTLRALVDAGAKVVVTAHLGRPKGEPDPKYSLRSVADRLAQLLGRPVEFALDTVGESARILAQDSGEFLKLMLRWLNAFVPKPGQTIPGVEDEMFDNIRVPTLIIRGGENDLDHPKRTSLEVSCLIKGSTLIDPPWPEDAWERAGEDRASGKAKRFNMFDTWVQAAPAILDFLDK